MPASRPRKRPMAFQSSPILSCRHQQYLCCREAGLPGAPSSPQMSRAILNWFGIGAGPAPRPQSKDVSARHLPLRHMIAEFPTCSSFWREPGRSSALAPEALDEPACLAALAPSNRCHRLRRLRGVGNRPRACTRRERWLGVARSAPMNAGACHEPVVDRQRSGFRFSPYSRGRV
jgi:hypothetical protein